MNYIKEYLFKADWYDDHRDKEQTSYGLVMGKSYTDVMAKIEQRLPYVNNIEINEYEENDFVWMNECNYNRMKSVDNEIMFDFPDEKEEIIKCGQPSTNPKDRWPREEKTSLLEPVYGTNVEWDKFYKDTLDSMTDYDEKKNETCPYQYWCSCEDCSDNNICEYADLGPFGRSNY